MTWIARLQCSWPLRASAVSLLTALAACSAAHVSEHPDDGGAGSGGVSGTTGGKGNPTPADAGPAISGGTTVTPADAGPAGGGPAPSADANCGLSMFTLERLPPDVLIVLDKSESMSQIAMLSFTCLYMKCNSKWEDMTSALNATVTKTQATVNWGLELFPSDDLCGVTGMVSAPVAPNNAAAVSAAIAAAAPSGNTPTRLALEAGGRYLMGLGRPNPRYVVLATDGVPNCSGARMGADDQPTIDAVGALATAGIPVFVIGVGTQGGADATLSAMAMAGGKPRAGKPAYYAVNTAGDLSMALETIGGQIVSCTLPIKQPPDPTNIAVDADGVRVPKNDSDGWAYGPGMTTIELRGSYCTNYQKGAIKDVKAIFGCPGVVIP
jgi:von Willebrand factor type A domain